MSLHELEPLCLAPVAVKQETLACAHLKLPKGSIPLCDVLKDRMNSHNE